MTSTIEAVPTRTQLKKQSPIVKRLYGLAVEFDDAARFYGAHGGLHNCMLRDESTRCAAQLRLVASFVRQQVYTERQGYDWIKASWRIINAIGRANILR